MEKEKSSSKKLTNLFIIISVLLLIVSCVLLIKVIKLSEDVKTQIVIKHNVISEKDKMLIQLENLQIEYDDLSSEYKNLGELFNEEKDKVNSLIKEISKQKGSVSAYKNKVSVLKEQLKNYLSRIEVLQERNQELNAENIQVKTSLDSALTENIELSSKNENLSAKVEAGSMLKAYEIFADGIRIKSNGKEIPTHKAKRVKKIRTCFLLSENNIAEKGVKTIYLRIASPTGKILFNKKEKNNMFIFEGEEIAYTLKQEINYENKSMDLCFYWDNIGELQKGMYYIDIFVDDYQIGSTKFNLE